MAANIFDGSTDSNWGTAANWSLNAVPTASDGNVATFDATSPACTVNASNRVANAINFTGYTNTITMTYAITVSGAITLEGTMGVAGTGGLTANTTATLTSDAKTWPNAFTFAGTSQTYTLADDWDIDGTLTFGETTAATINGQTIYAGGSITCTTTATVTGTTVIVMDGTGTLNTVATGRIIGNPLTINTAGTITLGSVIAYRTGTFTYIAGTIVNAGSTFYIIFNCTLDTSGMSFLNVSFTVSSTVTLTSDWNIAGNLTTGSLATTQTFNGAFNINVSGNLTHNGTTGTVTGTATIVLAGTGNWSLPVATTGNYNIAVVINTAGTITLTSNIQFGNTLASLTYTAGTLVSTGYKFYTGTMTLNLNGLTIAGLYHSMASVGTLTLSSGLVISEYLGNGDSASHMSIVSNVADTQRTLTLLQGATQDLCKVDATDIDSSAGQTIYTHRGVLDNATNWVSYTQSRNTILTF